MATATINFVNPTTRVDGSALDPSQIASVDVFDSMATIKITTITAPIFSYTTGLLTPGVHNFTAVWNDYGGNSSAPSASASVTVPAPIANPSPGTITAVLNP
jgi:hypothetical protein